MELPDFLNKFFYLYGDQADVLAYMMGYQEPAETQAEENMEADSMYQDWVKANMESFEIIKSLQDAESLPEVLSKLTEDQYLSVLKDQEKIEKAIKKATKESKPTKAEDTSIVGEVKNKGVSPSVVIKNKESKMDEELVEKSALVDLQKTLDANKAELQKALDLVKKFEDEKKEAVLKARKAEVVAAVKDEAKAEILFKAVKDASDEDFTAVVKTLTELQSLVEKSELFKETGAATKDEEKPEQESAVAKVLKAKLAKAK